MPPKDEQRRLGSRHRGAARRRHRFVTGAAANYFFLSGAARTASLVAALIPCVHFEQNFRGYFERDAAATHQQDSKTPWTGQTRNSEVLQIFVQKK